MTAAAIVASGGRAVAVAADISVSAEVNAMVYWAIEELGGIEVLVNNAGVGKVPAPTLELDMDAWDKVMAINVRGTFHCSQKICTVDDRPRRVARSSTWPPRRVSPASRTSTRMGRPRLRSST